MNTESILIVAVAVAAAVALPLHHKLKVDSSSFEPGVPRDAVWLPSPWHDELQLGH